jgi:hypothetical protein
MKPIIVTVNHDGKVIMTKDQFEKIIDDVYEEGKKDGTPVISFPSTQKTITTPYVPIEMPYHPTTTPWSSPVIYGDGSGGTCVNSEPTVGGTDGVDIRV